MNKKINCNFLNCAAGMGVAGNGCCFLDGDPTQKDCDQFKHEYSFLPANDHSKHKFKYLKPNELVPDKVTYFICDNCEHEEPCFSVLTNNYYPVKCPFDNGLKPDFVEISKQDFESVTNNMEAGLVAY